MPAIATAHIRPPQGAGRRIPDTTKAFDVCHERQRTVSKCECRQTLFFQILPELGPANVRTGTYASRNRHQTGPLAHGLRENEGGGGGRG